MTRFTATRSTVLAASRDVAGVVVTALRSPAGQITAEPDSDIGTWMGLCRAAWRADRAEVLRLADGRISRWPHWDAEVPWL